MHFQHLHFEFVRWCMTLDNHQLELMIIKLHFCLQAEFHHSKFSRMTFISTLQLTQFIAIYIFEVVLFVEEVWQQAQWIFLILLISFFLSYINSWIRPTTVYWVILAICLTNIYQHLYVSEKNWLIYIRTSWNIGIAFCLKNQFVSNLDVNDLYTSVSKKHTEFYHGSVWKCFILHTIMSKQAFI